MTAIVHHSTRTSLAWFNRSILRRIRHSLSSCETCTTNQMASALMTILLSMALCDWVSAARRFVLVLMPCLFWPNSLVWCDRICMGYMQCRSVACSSDSWEVAEGRSSAENVFGGGKRGSFVCICLFFVLVLPCRLLSYCTLFQGHHSGWQNRWGSNKGIAVTAVKLEWWWTSQYFVNTYGPGFRSRAGQGWWWVYHLHNGLACLASRNKILIICRAGELLPSLLLLSILLEPYTKRSWLWPWYHTPRSTLKIAYTKT